MVKRIPGKTLKTEIHKKSTFLWTQYCFLGVSGKSVVSRKKNDFSLYKQ